MNNKINIIIPINGLGIRFKKYFIEPKPLIKIFDKEMIFWLLDGLNYKYINKIYIPYNYIFQEYDFENLLKNRYKHVQFEFIKLYNPTRGAAETLNIALNSIKIDEMKCNFMCMDCDTFYHEDVIKLYIENENKNVIFYSEDYNSNPIFSYIKIKNNLVFQIEEKNRISNFANCGIFCFEDGFVMKKYLHHMLDNAIMQKDEFYISGVYKIMIENNEKISSIQIQNFSCVGTPDQLQEFINKKRGKYEY